MSVELSNKIDALNSAFEQFKTSNDERIAQVEARGHADPLVTESVEKANAEISRLQGEIGELKSQSESIKALANRPNMGGEKVNKDIEAEASTFYSMKNDGRLVIPTSDQIEAYGNYKNAFMSWVRSGESITPDVRAALSVGSNPDGGFWVSPDTTGRIAELVYETSPMRQICSVQTISTDALEGSNDLDEAAAGGWVGEKAARSDSNTPQVGEWRIPAHEQYAQPKATQKLLDDAAVGVEEWLARKIADKLSRVENDAFLNGDGSGKPRGLLTYTAGAPTKANWQRIEQTNSGASGAFAGTDPGDPLIDLVFSVKSVYRGNANWLMNRATVAEVRKLKDGDGNYMWQPDFSVRQGGNLLGYGIVEGEDMPDIAANSLSIAFGDFREGYQIVDRQGIRVLRDPFTDKPYVKFYTTKRTGGAVVNFEALKLMKFAA